MMTLLVLVWGTAFVSIKVLGRHLDFVEITWFRYVPFLVIFAVWLPLRRRERFAMVTGPDWVRYGVAGALAVLGYHLPLNWAMSDLTPGTPISGGMAAVLVATTPLWTMLWVVMSTREDLTRRHLQGALLAFGGVAVVVFYGRPDAQGPEAAGKAFIALLAPVFWSIYSLVAKPLIARYGGLFTTGVTMGIGTAMLLPTGLARGVEPLYALGPIEWYWLAYLSLLATVGGYVAWNQALKRRSASQVTAYIFAVPVVATLAGALLIGERVTLWYVLGAAAVLYGLWTIQRPVKS